MADSRNIRGVTFGLAIATTATLIVGIAPAALAETRIETVIGTVSGADPIRTSYIRKTPKDERVCQTQDVPVYGEAAGNNESDLGAMIIGGVIGSAIGNKTSDNEGAGAAGAVVGALLGREHAKKNQGGGQQIIGYRQQEVCNIRTVMTEQTVEEITGYRVRIEVDGKIISLESKRPRNMGERVEINRKTTYSLR
ncbi:MAG: hypothetical protein L7W95_08585 [Alphaproteobacteria bacterium]|jgi:uncharacterized protein YcfJ|nr:hypothetical protein [SAR116 cluster bacterium]MCH1483905.1 hypothetical protein [Alphaproteobacteria bacterium]